MSRRRGPPRLARATARYTSASYGESDEELTLLQVFESILQQNKRRRSNQRLSTSRRAPKRPNTAKDSEKKKPKKPSENADILFVESDDEKKDNAISETVTTNHLKKVENKVNNFFKSNNLLSDDDDEDIIPISTTKASPPESKDFYELSDSDEELNKVIKSASSEKTTTVSSLPGPSGSQDNKEDSTKSDALMDIVDKILVGDNNIDLTNNEPDENWSSYKNKAEDMLGSINNLLSEIDKQTKPPEEPKPSPEKPIPTCPVCLEQLGGETIMMTTMCGHIFCNNCITQIAKTSKKCPTCRKQVNLKKIHAVYL